MSARSHQVMLAIDHHPVHFLLPALSIR